MSRPALLCLLLLAGLTLRAQDQSYADCVVKANSSWGQPCEKCEAYRDNFRRDYSGVFQVELKNACSDIVEVKVAMQEANGNWRTFPIKTLAGGQAMTAFACKGTGKYLYWVRRLNDTEILLPSDQEIVAAYRGR